MRNLKIVLLSLILAVSITACGDDDEPENNGTANNGTADAGDTNGGDADLACDETQQPTCCDSSLQSVDATCNEDTTEWECPSGSTSLPVGGVCGESDAGDTGGGDSGDTADAGA